MIKRYRIVAIGRTLAVAAVVVVLVGVVVAAGPALAAKGGVKGKPSGNGGGGNGGNGTSATLTVTPDPVAAYTHPTVSGKGFRSGKELLVGIPGDLRFTSVTPDSTGSFSFVYTARDLAPGTYPMEAWGPGKGKTWELKAATTFTVVP